MKTFIEYLISLSESSAKHDILGELIKLIWSRYNPETKDFLEKIADKDADVKRLLDKLNNNFDGSQKFNDEEIYNSASDSNFGNEEI